MLYVHVVRDGKTPISARVVSKEERLKLKQQACECRVNWHTFEAADAIARLLGPEYVATDAGPWVSPRFDVIRVPQVGDEVSYEFNGDSYPCGKITRVSAAPFHRRVEATDENGSTHVFYRQRASGAWIKNQTWSLVRGHVNKRNPSF